LLLIIVEIWLLHVVKTNWIRLPNNVEQKKPETKAYLL
jgi:hypothetical protein